MTPTSFTNQTRDYLFERLSQLNSGGLLVESVALFVICESFYTVWCSGEITWACTNSLDFISGKECHALYARIALRLTLIATSLFALALHLRRGH